MKIVQYILYVALMLVGVGFEICALMGVNRFKFSLNRLHSASIGDTMGLAFILLACIVRSGLNVLSIKFAVIFIIMLVTCPMSSHVLSLLVYRTDNDIEKEAPVWKR